MQEVEDVHINATVI